jgi:hypothetical protein
MSGGMKQLATDNRPSTITGEHSFVEHHQCGFVAPLPYPEPDRLVAVCESNPRLGWDQYVNSRGAFSDWREQSSAIQELAGATVRAGVDARVNNNVRDHYVP